MTQQQRGQIESFINSRKSIMTMEQGKAIVQAILENHDMLEELRRELLEPYIITTENVGGVAMEVVKKENKGFSTN